MTTIALPSQFHPETFTLRQYTNQRAHGSPGGGSEQVIDLLNDRWMVSLTLPRGHRAYQARNEAFINAMRGMTNTCNLWHYDRPVPFGTMRGTPTCAAASQGAASLVLTVASGATLQGGDMIGVGGMLLQVAADATAVGTSLTVSIVNRLRYAITAGSAVTWDRPTAVFRLISSPAVQYAPGYAEGVSLDFAEVIP